MSVAEASGEAFEMQLTRSALNSRLDQWAVRLREVAGVWETIDEMNRELTNWRFEAPGEMWREIVRDCREHPIAGLIHDDLFTSWSFRKPRGYPGDATLLDFIYQHDDARPLLQAVSARGQAIYAYARQVAACSGVRHRRDRLAARIDEICNTRDRARILSVACGHLREAGLSDAIATGRLETLIALDQDQESLRTLADAHRGRKVDPRHVSVRQLLSGKFTESNFDLIYAAGLYDYLEDRVAERLTRVLFEKLRPGGKLLIANFLDTVPDAGYMETFMDWFLILRSPAQFRRVLKEIAREGVSAAEFSDDAIIYLEVTRRLP